MDYRSAKAITEILNAMFSPEESWVTKISDGGPYIEHTYPNSDNGNPLVQKLFYMPQVIQAAKLSLGIALEKQHCATMKDMNEIFEQVKR